MQKKILVSMMVIGLVATLTGAGLYAYFNDTETSTGNVFTAGTIDCQLSNDGTSWVQSITATWSISGWAPGDSFEDVLYIRNMGTTGAVLGRFNGLEVVETDAGDGNTDIASRIFITTIKYSEGGTEINYNLVDYYATAEGGPKMDTSGDGKLSLREFVDSPYSMVFWTGEGIPGESEIDWLPAGGTVVETLRLGFTFDPTAENEYQGDSATFTLRVTADDDPAILGKGGDCYGY